MRAKRYLLIYFKVSVLTLHCKPQLSEHAAADRRRDWYGGTGSLLEHHGLCFSGCFLLDYAEIVRDVPKYRLSFHHGVRH